MALQGTIDTFPLTDVLSLLGASAKTGRLVVDGDRGLAQIWVADGALVGGDVAGRPLDDASNLVFELLRFDDGAFEFTALGADDLPDADLDPVELAVAIAAAEELRAEWAEIEAVVPSTDHRVHLVDELPVEELVVDAALWSVLVVAGSNPSVDELAVRLGLGEFAACAAVASLVERELAVIDEPAAPTTAITVVGADLAGAAEEPVPTEVEPWRELVTDDGERRHGFPDRFPIDDLIGDEGMEHADPWSSPEMEQLEAQRRSDADAADAAEQVSFASLPPIQSVPFGESEEASWPDPVVQGEEPADESADEVFDDPSRSTAAAWDEIVEADAAAAGRSEEDTADEVLRQMSKLSPKAAEAIAAALSTVPAPSGDDDRDDERGDGGPVSFLGSF